MTNCQREKLRRDIRTYWSKSSAQQRYTHYIKDILPREMACAQTEPGRLPDKKCEQLIFLVGHSLEPLFQSVWAYQPQQVLLILSKYYGADVTGQGRGLEIKRLLEKELPLVADITPPKVISEVIDDTSTQSVFRKLQECIRQDTKPRSDGTRPVIVDITGAKKSMVAGAFLFAAYADVPVSYVDFDDDAYDITVSRPYGDACRIGEIANPYQNFALRDWERVRTLYTRYNFQGARQVLVEKIMPAMNEFFPKETQKVNRLIEILSCYELWDSGNFTKARQQDKAIQTFTPPSAVEILGKDGYWPHADDAKLLKNDLDRVECGQANIRDTLYLAPHLLITYAEDELERVSRLIRFNADYRSALLRAVSLWEVLLRARVVGAWHANLMEIALTPQGQYVDRSSAPHEVIMWEDEIYQSLIYSDNNYAMIRALRFKDENKYRDKFQEVPCRRKSSKEKMIFYIRRRLSAPFLDENSVIGIEQELRNKAIHTYLSIPQKIAHDTVNKVRTSLIDYKKNWLPAIWPDFVPSPIKVEAMLWSDLWQLCDLNFLPANLRSDEDVKEITR